jgi:hypothetical protein
MPVVDLLVHAGGVLHQRASATACRRGPGAQQAYGMQHIASGSSKQQHVMCRIHRMHTMCACGTADAWNTPGSD